MDEISVRPKYTRQSLPMRRRKNVKEQSTLFEGIMKQLVISVLILLVIGVIKSVDTPITVYINERLKSILFQEIDVKSIYTSIADFIKVFAS